MENYDGRLYIQTSKPRDELQQLRLRLRMTMHIRRSRKKKWREREREERSEEIGIVSKRN